MNHDPLARLESKTVKDSITGCWLWMGSRNDRGYGNIKLEGRSVKVHRLSASIYLGYKLSDEICQVLHNRECPNKNCWNPDHLHIGTNEDNQAERFPKSHCVNGHTYTPENTILVTIIPWRYKCRECHNTSNRKTTNNNDQQ